MTTTPSKANKAEDLVPVDLVTLTIDDVEVSVPKGTLLIRAAELIGTAIPRFCDHPLLDPVGACRQCLVEITDAGNGRAMPKPAASCTIEVAAGMIVKTQVTSPVANKAQNGNMEFLLINHPLDCPICDKGGECPLQNQSLANGYGESRYIETKRTFAKPISISPQILLDRERCILCARCTRFQDQIAGDPFIDMLDRGAFQQVGIYEEEPFHSYWSGNTIQICPVGALTSADYRFRSRPFDLVSTPSVAEHDACGSAIRVDNRRGKVMRRQAGDDPEVNEEWISDKDRFAFTYPTVGDRITRPLVRDEETGELEPVSWPAALFAAARGLEKAEGKVGVLPGGRLTIEDAYAYSKFARTVLGTNDIDFRARAHSAEEEAFLAAHVAATGLTVTYRDLEKAGKVVLIGIEPEDEAGIIFLRLRKASRDGLKVESIGTHATPGLLKTDGKLIQTRPGDEPAAIKDLELDATSIVLVGERLASVPGAFSAAMAAAKSSGARLAWIPRRAGDRGAVDVGCLPNLLPGGRPLSDATARADLAAAWGVKKIAAKKGRDTSKILGVVQSGALKALVIGGVEIADLPDPKLARSALETADFVVSLEVRESEATALADVVLPVAPTVAKPGTFINWEGRKRPFDTVLHESNSLADIRILAGIGEELGVPLGFRTVTGARADLDEVGEWDGARAEAPDVEAVAVSISSDNVLLDTWRLMIDDGRGQDGQKEYKLTARPAVLRANARTLEKAGLADGRRANLSTSTGDLEFRAELAELPDDVVWVPSNSAGKSLRDVLGAGYADQVVLSGGAK